MIPIDSDVTLLQGDVEDALPQLPENSVDCVVTDPPYALSMGGGTAGWDSYGAHGFEAWCEQWGREALRVAKPGAWMVAAGSARTEHRLKAGLEDAGWQIVDSIDWIYPSSFERGVDLSARLSRAGEQEAADAMDGRATSVKSRREPFALCRAPLSDGLIQTVAKWGTATLDVVATDTDSGAGPSNVAVSHAYECEIGERCVSWCPISQLGPNGHLFPAFYWASKPSTSERPRVEVEIGQGTKKLSTIGELRHWLCGTCGIPTQSYMKKSNVYSSVPWKICDHDNWIPIKANDYVSIISHNTVKPLSLMQWLIRLVCPQGGLILEPFAGSGSTVEAAVLERRRVVAIERDVNSVELVRSRLRRSRCMPVEKQALITC